MFCVDIEDVRHAYMNRSYHDDVQDPPACDLAYIKYVALCAVQEHFYPSSTANRRRTRENGGSK